MTHPKLCAHEVFAKIASDAFRGIAPMVGKSVAQSSLDFYDLTARLRINPFRHTGSVWCVALWGTRAFVGIVIPSRWNAGMK